MESAVHIGAIVFTLMLRDAILSRENAFVNQDGKVRIIDNTLLFNDMRVVFLCLVVIVRGKKGVLFRNFTF